MSDDQQNAAMVAGFFQFPVAFADLERNMQIIQQALAQASFDLLVLPEMCSTGYMFDSREHLLPYGESAEDGVFVEFLLALSAQKQATLIAGMVERNGDALYNTAVVLSRGKHLGKQRKCHLSKLEKKLFDAGSSLQCFDDGNCRFGVLTCFDLWIPEAARVLARDGAQLFCCPANYGGPWTTGLVRTRAMENGSYLICCNRSGREAGVDFQAHFRGESQILGRMGEVLLAAQEETLLGLQAIYPTDAAIKSNVMCDDLMAEARRYHLHGPQ
ncbi:nitrilase-related carbon-nitrogen hydrolase [Collimonas pratensis]|uniref:Carbon-nitrogen hydrolase family protein n=1 Tax=Collimonas pratensis TaxID=279113 RepID=A0ABN4M6C2_9BURK|nr:nitrilase-related carbon-nitrogen hydrolase [Collimonas pratensis]AMP12902.1 carbon-nitrogen hydrolase family protein [Collimonas pratensis]